MESLKPEPKCGQGKLQARQGEFGGGGKGGKSNLEKTPKNIKANPAPPPHSPLNQDPHPHILWMWSVGNSPGWCSKGVWEKTGIYPDDDPLGDVGCQRVVLVLGVCLQGHHQHEVPAEGHSSGTHPVLGRAGSPSPLEHWAPRRARSTPSPCAGCAQPLPEQGHPSGVCNPSPIPTSHSSHSAQPRDR